MAPTQRRASTSPLRAAQAAQSARTKRLNTMHLKRSNNQRIMEAAHALTPNDSELKDNDALLRLLIQRLERIAELIDELDAHIDELDQRTMAEAVQRITGAGIAGLVIKSDALSSRLDRFSAVLRSNELRRQLPPEGRGERR
jgi:hypothetical protein